MKDRKSLYLVIFALSVVTISFILISIWGYNFYFQPKVPQTVTQEVQQGPKVSISKKTSMRDSLQTLLTSTVEQLGTDSSFSDSSTDKTLELKLIEFNKLKNEIAEILKNKTSSKDMSEASEKIGELQKSVDELRSKNDEVAKENMRLNKVLKELIIENKSSERKTKTSVNNKVIYPEQLPVLVSHLSFKGVTESDNNEKETNIAAQTVKLTGSFLLSAKPTNNSTSIYVVIVKPDGNTLLNSSWQSGTFETGSGRQTYSALIHFDNVKDNNNRLQFTIDARNFQKGKYAMQIYHQGIMIGRLVKTFY
ncbi:MAG TPA: hypothetical protein VN722_02145 [Hanamia sp.]|nr:hypothetical protein [Hanamia sp.]